MRGEKTLASGNVFQWTVTKAVGRIGVSGNYVGTPSAEDIAETEAFALSLMPDDFVPESEFVGMGEVGKRRAKAAFEQHLGRSSN